MENKTERLPRWAKAIKVSLLLLALLSISTVSYADLRLLLIDPDPDGTNLRDAPKGNVLTVIPKPGKNAPDEALEKRTVVVTGQSGDWFSVVLADKQRGWLHKTMLGSCAAATEDGKAHLKAAPHDSAKSIASVPSDTKLAIKAVKGTWAQVEYRRNGKKISGWLPEQCLFSNPYNSCWR